MTDTKMYSLETWHHCYTPNGQLAIQISGRVDCFTVIAQWILSLPHPI